MLVQVVQTQRMLVSRFAANLDKVEHFLQARLSGDRVTQPDWATMIDKDYIDFLNNHQPPAAGTSAAGAAAPAQAGSKVSNRASPKKRSKANATARKHIRNADQGDGPAPKKPRQQPQPEQQQQQAEAAGAADAATSTGAGAVGGDRVDNDDDDDDSDEEEVPDKTEAYVATNLCIPLPLEPEVKLDLYPIQIHMPKNPGFSSQVTFMKQAWKHEAGDIKFVEPLYSTWMPQSIKSLVACRLVTHSGRATAPTWEVQLITDDETKELDFFKDKFDKLLKLCSATPKGLSHSETGCRPRGREVWPPSFYYKKLSPKRPCFTEQEKRRCSCTYPVQSLLSLQQARKCAERFDADDAW